jgi:hypothetical protein
MANPLRLHVLLIGFVVLLPAWPASASASDYRVVFWYDRARPLDTFKYQAYDLRKGQFTPEVERWLALMKEKYPNYNAYTRDIDLTREQGDTEKHKIGSAIVREFVVLGTAHGYDFAGVSPGARPPLSAPAMTRSEARPSVFRPMPGSSTPLFTPGTSPPPTFPVPFPFPRQPP